MSDTMPNLPPDLPAWLDRVEGYCKKAEWAASYDALILNPGEFDKNIRAFSLKALIDLPHAVQVIRELVKEQHAVGGEEPPEEGEG